jgi:3-oxoacyl-[acyl-carrier protein] reductase
MASFDLAGKTALVTGAAKRRGMHCALTLADRGANVVVRFGASAGDAQALRAEIRRRGVRAWPVQADAGDASQS